MKKNIIEKVLKSTFNDSNCQIMDFYPERLEKELEGANILILPKPFKEQEIPLFPEQTHTLLNYFQDNKTEGLKIEIVADDESYNELELHHDIVYMASLLVEFAVLPLLIGVFSNYLYDYFSTKVSKSKVKLKIHVTDGNQVKDIDFEGNHESFKDFMNNKSKNLF